MALTGRISGLRYRVNSIFSSVFVVEFKYAHVNALFSIVGVVERLNIKIRTSSALNRDCCWGTTHWMRTTD